jgi:glycosyltransferase involved in cell wall biosynthesis
MKILYVITGLNTGGAELQTAEIASRIKALGNEVELVSMTDISALPPKLAAAGIPVCSLGMNRGRANPVAILRLAKIVRRFRPDIVHSHIAQANILCRVTRLVSPMNRLICTAHSDNECGPLLTKLYGMTDFLCDRMTNVSQNAVNVFIERGISHRKRISCVYNGIDTNRFSPSLERRRETRRRLGLEGKTVILFVGRFEWAKAPDVLVEAFMPLARLRSELALLMVGDGTMRGEVERLLDGEGLKNRAVFTGLRADTENYYNAADFFVMPSRWEGFGLSLVEAMACGLPIIATDCSGPREILEGGRFGRLVRPENSRALLEAIAAALDQRPQDGESERARASLYVRERFDIQSIIAKWDGLYRETVGAH